MTTEVDAEQKLKLRELAKQMRDADRKTSDKTYRKPFLETAEELERQACALDQMAGCRNQAQRI